MLAHEVQWQEGARTGKEGKGVEKEIEGTVFCMFFWTLYMFTRGSEKDDFFFFSWQWALSACPSWCYCDGRITMSSDPRANALPHPS